MRASLFWSPLGSGIPAGVLLARHIPLSPPITFALYAASDLLGALVCYPLFTALRRHARRVRALHCIGTRMLRLAMLGTRAPRAAEVSPSSAGAVLASLRGRICYQGWRLGPGRPVVVFAPRAGRATALPCAKIWPTSMPPHRQRWCDAVT